MPGGKWGSSKRNGLSFKDRRHTEEAKEKQSKASTGRIHTPKSKEKMAKNNFAKRDPEKQKEHAKAAASLPKSEIHRENLRLAALKNLSGKSNLGKKRTKVKCPHCGKEGANNTMSRWHFANCTVEGKSIGADTGL